MKLETMEGSVMCRGDFPPHHSKHYDVVAANSRGELLLGTSNRASRYWFGSLWFYQNTEDLTDPYKASSAVAIQSGVNDVQWLSDSVIVAGLDTGAVAGWKVNVQEQPFTPLWEAVEHDHLVRALTVYKPRNHVISAGYDGLVKIWEIEDDIGSSIQTYKGHSDLIHSIDHHSEEPMFVTTSLDGNIILWDSRKTKPCSAFTDFAQYGPTCARFLSQSQLAIGDFSGHVRIGDLRSPKESLHLLESNKQRITDMKLSRCGSMLATAGEDGLVNVYKLNDPSYPRIYQYSHDDYVRCLTWSGEKELVSCAYVCDVKKHDVLPDMDLNGDKTAEGEH